MPIVRINVHKVNAERKLNSGTGQINIQNNVAIKDIEKLEFDKEGKNGLKFTFEFNCTYEPNYGKIEVAGQVFYVDEAKIINDIKKEWDTNKKIDSQVMEPIINAALHKGTIQAIKIAEDADLPSPLPLPKVTGTVKK